MRARERDKNLDVRIVRIFNTYGPNLGMVGRYILTPGIFSVLKDTQIGKNNELQLTDAIRNLMENEEIYSFEINETVYDVGNKLDYSKTFIDLAVDKFGDEIVEHMEKHVD